jgi:hypothetical protein
MKHGGEEVLQEISKKKMILGKQSRSVYRKSCGEYGAVNKIIYIVLEGQELLRVKKV